MAFHPKHTFHSGLALRLDDKVDRGAVLEINRRVQCSVLTHWAEGSGFHLCASVTMQYNLAPA